MTNKIHGFSSVSVVIDSKMGMVVRRSAHSTLRGFWLQFSQKIFPSSFLVNSSRRWFSTMTVLHLMPRNSARNGYGMRFIPKKDWLGSWPDMAPMDYCVNDVLNWALFYKAPTTLLGLKRVITSVWKEVYQEKINAALKSWPKCVDWR